MVVWGSEEVCGVRGCAVGDVGCRWLWESPRRVCGDRGCAVVAWYVVGVSGRQVCGIRGCVVSLGLRRSEAWVWEEWDGGGCVCW